MHIANPHDPASSFNAPDAPARASRLRRGLRTAALAVLLVSLAAPARAETFDYGKEEKLTATSLNNTKAELTLGGLITLIEAQTSFTFVYMKSEIPMDAVLALDTGEAVPLSHLLAQASAQQAVVFKTSQNGKIAVRKRRAEDTVTAPAPTASSPAASVPAAAAGADSGVVKLDDYRVEAATARANSRESFTELRRSVDVAVETLSAEDMGKFTGSDVSDLMIRIPGVSTSTTGNFAVIRGLSERYNSVTLNGLVLPSSDPERQSTELDQFPSRLLDGIVVYKNFSPELPGNLSGGGVEMKTLSFPSKRILSFTVGGSMDESVFTGDNDFLTYASAGHGDLWAHGTDDRLTTDDVVTLPTATRIDTSNRPFTAYAKNMPVGPKASFLYGETFNFKSGLQIGVSLGLTYDSSYSTETGTVDEGGVFSRVAGKYVPETYTSVSTGEQTPIPRDGNSYIRSEQNIMLGGLANIAVRFNPYHQVSLTAFTSQTSTDTAQYDYDMIHWDDGDTLQPASQHRIDAGGIDPTTTADRYRYTLNYRERNLSTLALAGEHVFPDAHDGKLSWAGALSTAYQDEPDNRSLLYYQPYGEDYYTITIGTDQIKATWREVEEDQGTGRLSWQQPLGQRGALFEFGGTFSTTERAYSERMGVSKAYDASGTQIGDGQFDSPEDLSDALQTSFLGSASANVDLARDIEALYLRASTPFFSPQLKLGGGIRFEKTMIDSSGFGRLPDNPGLSSAWHYTRNYYYFPELLPYATGSITPEYEEAANVGIDQVDFLPAVNLAWNATDKLLFRLAASKTVARPSLRELGNYFTWNESTERYDHGNAFLKISEVLNLDLRAEYYFGGGDLISLSVFYKEVENPIEKYGGLYYPSNDEHVGTWFNNPSTATLKGIEFEFRKGFGFLGDRWEGVSLGGNATWIEAEVKGFGSAGSGLGLVALDETRRLYDQPEWIYNLDLTYAIKRWGSAITLSYIATSDVLTQVNSPEGFDEYLDKTSRFDLTYSQRLGDRFVLKFSVKNLFDPEYKYIRDTEQTGGVEIVDRRWREGRSYTAQITAEF